MNDIVPLIFSAFIAGFFGNEIGYRVRKSTRSKYGKLAIGLLSGFVSVILILLIQARIQSYSLFMAVVIGIFYGFLMANGRAFKNIK